MLYPSWIITDLDETLLLEDSTISERTLKAIENIRSKGVKFGIATTRSKNFAQSYIDLLQPDIAVVNGGALAYNEEKVVYQQPIDNYLLKKLLKPLQLKKIVIDTTKGRFNSLSELNILKDIEVLSLFVWLEKGENIAPFKNQNSEIEITKLWEPGMYRLSHYKATKAIALKQILKKHDPKSIFCFGDDLMDVGMLDHFYGIAVANALNEAKAVADEITLSNKEEGFAHRVEQLLN
jgi:HAD superfamily hydrolase (TIGR01484 family)